MKNTPSEKRLVINRLSLAKNPYEAFGDTMPNIERKITLSTGDAKEHHCSVSREELARVLSKYQSVTLTPKINAYVQGMLTRSVKAIPGPKPASALATLSHTASARAYYQRVLRHLQAAKKRNRLDRFPLLNATSWWHGAPSERAARMTAMRFFPNCTPGHVLNVLFSDK